MIAGGSTSPNPLPWVQRLDMGWYLLPFRGAGVNSTHTPPNTHSRDGILRGGEKKERAFYIQPFRRKESNLLLRPP